MRVKAPFRVEQVKKYPRKDGPRTVILYVFGLHIVRGYVDVQICRHKVRDW